MRLILLLVAVFFVVLMALTVWLYSVIGPLSFLVMLVLLAAGMLVLKALAAKMLHKAFIAPFAMKGKVLHDATTQIHSVEPASRPARQLQQTAGDESDDDEDEDQDEDDAEEYNRYYTIDVTISPQQPASQGVFTVWEPGELILVHPDTPSGTPDSDDGEVGSIVNVHFWQDGAWTEDDGIKAPGPQRLKLLAGVQDGVTQCRFRYYFEVFGSVDLPSD